MPDRPTDTMAPGARADAPLRIVIIDDSESIRGVLRRVLGARRDFSVVADYESARAAALSIRQDRPDVIVMDLHMPGPSGSEAVELLTGAFAAPILILTGSARNADLAAVMAAGARGCVLKQVDVRELEEAIRIVAAGGTFIASGIRTTETP